MQSTPPKRPAAAMPRTGLEGFVFFVFLGYVLYVYLQGGVRFPVLGSIRFEFIVGAFLGVAALVALRRGATTAREPLHAIARWVLAVLAVTILATLFSEAHKISFDVFVDRVLKFMMLTLFIRAFVDTPVRLRWFLGAYLFAFLKMAQEGILGLVTGSLVWENQGTPRLHGATPNYEHPNSFSGTQLVTLPFLLFLMPVASKGFRIVLALQAAAACAIVITTGSRTGYVALALWLIWVVWNSRARLKTFVIAGLAIACILPIVPRDYYDRFETIFTQKDKEGGSIEARKVILQDAVAIFSEHPLGVGVGAFPEVRIREFNRFQPTHNLYLEVACDLGIQGLIVFLGFVICMLQTARRYSKALGAQLDRLRTARAVPGRDPAGNEAFDQHVRDVWLMEATTRAVMSFLVIRLGLGLFGHDFYELYWWFAAGLLLAIGNMMRAAAVRTDELAGAAVPETRGPRALRKPGGVVLSGPHRESR